MDELKAWLQQKLEERFYRKLTDENINALHQAGYDEDLLSLASRESLKELQLPLAVVDMLLAKCGSLCSQSTGAGGRGGRADVGVFGPNGVGTSLPTNSDEVSTRYVIKTPLLVKIIREHWDFQSLEKRKIS
ncbi:hypothetical protein HXX76_008093 [Chlamydomonas incerta]|uniref:Uncharacterized protein n=1 Tax=Chlamydomonas incerta TaxID=51695 RepID=A0A835T0U4_CHLIN|nr:hypothetical protein HXX76_008093 [Chlamydomonas incerta]|eukprot:KAG2433728.1 hypothetical protein HXX76_008093 [Chlamydomonas incerta]